jgi:hypothetical protein
MPILSNLQYLKAPPWEGLGRPVKAPKAWTDNYPNAEFNIISKENFLEYLI